jgi:hypothetical protein
MELLGQTAKTSVRIADAPHEQRPRTLETSMELHSLSFSIPPPDGSTVAFPTPRRVCLYFQALKAFYILIVHNGVQWIFQFI